MIRTLLIVFVKNMQKGKVKTRLAKTIGNQGALEVYKELVKTTELAVKDIAVDKRVYFSQTSVDTNWENEFRAVQQGKDLGERMYQAFKKGFEDGYERIVLIGSDLPDINKALIKEAFLKLQKAKVVFGPAQDGGYYLIGLTTMYSFIFENKPWSQPGLLHQTLSEIKQHNIGVKLLPTLNDIDTFEDLENSNFYKSNKKLQQKIQQIHDCIN